jgi:deoxyribodipyrimidine photo-lyase
MIANRRTRWNFALDRAIDWSVHLDRPLLVLEALRCDYPWASDRIHRFVIDGMRDNARALEGTGVGYFPYVEPAIGAGRGLLQTLASRAAVVVTDEFPCFFLPRMVAATAKKLDVRLESVDSNGLLPLRAADRAFARAFDFRRFLQKNLAPHLLEWPARDPLGNVDLKPLDTLSEDINRLWPRASDALLGGEEVLDNLAIDHSVSVLPYEGGSEAATSRLQSFLDQGLAAYGDDRNNPEIEGTSGLSPYLHFGHVSSHQIVEEIAFRENWSPARITDLASGKRAGWWSLPPATESFLDELVTWRELGYGFSFHRADYAQIDSLSEWARRTLAEHENDERPYLYTLAEFEEAQTHDELWNAAQNQLRSEGRIHNYLRMLWGKKILHWSSDPETALDIMIELNNKYAIDGRNPNSYSGIFWVLGRFDRAWGPEREIFGKVRYMSSKNTRRKLRVNRYIEHWSGNHLPETGVEASAKSHRAGRPVGGTRATHRRR